MVNFGENMSSIIDKNALTIAYYRQNQNIFVVHKIFTIKIASKTS